MGVLIVLIGLTLIDIFLKWVRGCKSAGLNPGLALFWMEKLNEEKQFPPLLFHTFTFWLKSFFSEIKVHILSVTTVEYHVCPCYVLQTLFTAEKVIILFKYSLLMFLNCIYSFTL